MWKKKKIMLIAALAVVVLVGSLGVVVYAQEGTTSGQPKTLLARVATILGIDQQKVEDAFKQAQKDMQAEALDARLKALVEQGKITQEQADQYKKWWQSRPVLSQYQQQIQEWQQSRPGLPQEFKDWQGAKPDVPLPGPRPFGQFRGHRFPGRW
ncbi:MAG: hypothetical protein HYX81_04065 [Chloroflexi bacterium]|nr:hypothetical protein [Chloroflexota bacterium]